MIYLRNLGYQVLDNIKMSENEMIFKIKDLKYFNNM